jgi:hypothetical protein
MSNETYKAGKYTIVEYPEEVIALNKELASGLHEDLEKHLAKNPTDDIWERLARVAAYCNIEVDGHFTSEEICDLCELCRVKLIDMRKRPGSSILLLQ